MGKDLVSLENGFDGVETMELVASSVVVEGSDNGRISVAWQHVQLLLCGARRICVGGGTFKGKSCFAL